MKGAWGEKAAREWLEKQGWRTVQANFRTRFGEIDLIAENERLLVFFEVQTRKNARFASACESVTPAKQARLLAAAEAWLQQNPTGKQPRFDVIEVYGEEGAGLPRIFTAIRCTNAARPESICARTTCTSTGRRR